MLKNIILPFCKQALFMRVIPIIGNEPPARNQTRPDTLVTNRKKKIKGNTFAFHSYKSKVLIARS